MIALQLSAIYFWSAYDKTSWAFLSGDRLEHYAMWFYFAEYPRWSGFPVLMRVAAIATVALEYALVIGLLYPATRGWLMLLGIILHAAFYVLLPVFTFSATMVCLYLAYCDPAFVHDTIDRLLGHEPSGTRAASRS